jgi:hypothetical protein
MVMMRVRRQRFRETRVAWTVMEKDMRIDNPKLPSLRFRILFPGYLFLSFIIR